MEVLSGWVQFADVQRSLVINILLGIRHTATTFLPFLNKQDSLSLSGESRAWPKEYYHGRMDRGIASWKEI